MREPENRMEEREILPAGLKDFAPAVLEGRNQVRRPEFQQGLRPLSGSHHAARLLEGSASRSLSVRSSCFPRRARKPIFISQHAKRRSAGAAKRAG